jgi:hypothetical protein
VQELAQAAAAALGQADGAARLPALDPGGPSYHRSANVRIPILGTRRIP